jgi:hypothetical protein
MRYLHINIHFSDKSGNIEHITVQREVSNDDDVILQIDKINSDIHNTLTGGSLTFMLVHTTGTLILPVGIVANTWFEFSSES